jgi:uncharacterized protein YfaT (DUF1175 family)
MDKDSREKRVWNNYLVVLTEHQIKSSPFTWYVRHCETFIRRNGDTRLKQHTKSSVSEYLSKSINEGSGEAWQKNRSSMQLVCYSKVLMLRYIRRSIGTTGSLRV